MAQIYLWTHWPRPLGATVPSIILYVKRWNRPAPQPRGSSHSPEGKNGRFRLITTERRGYKKIPLVGFQDIYKIDSETSFWPNRARIRGVLHVVTQISGWTLNFSAKKVGENASFLHFGVRNECLSGDWMDPIFWEVIEGVKRSATIQNLTSGHSCGPSYEVSKSARF
jgi:hypothetical protein